MKLQINDAGSWRHISRLDQKDEQMVRQRAAQLVVHLNDRAKLRILDEANAVQAHCQGPDFTWEDRK
ncbi:hypothetical protein B0920_02180 [Massilia sp. KIM]|uniref:hypothetical protein n=1 Tax=Massilia sp. KIM TaxID=1955422 RepID=UPI0009902E03|nr:hypothetical protein [Massilia sp. KIM]OON62307.1 hypothetical protein B0920_02180 [Massilia sp. KIM]